MNKKRSRGVTICGIALIIWPFFHFLKMAAPVHKLDFIQSLLPSVSSPEFLIQKLLFVVCGIGLLCVQKWARLLVIGLAIFGLVIWIGAVIYSQGLSLFNQFLHIVLYAFLLWFFLQPKVKEQFK